MSLSAHPESPRKRASSRSLVVELKESGTDFEWYPTTEAILQTIKEDIDIESPSVLDCGAGDGRSLMYLTNGKRYAIEKCEPLLRVLDRSIFIVGTEFQEQTLIDKKVDVVFSNPPFAEFTPWANKLIRESNCSLLYLVMPVRWTEDDTIQSAISSRQAKTEVIGSFDFLNAERAARARVDVVRVQLGYGRERRRHNKQPRVDPFDLWFDTEFNLHINNSAASKYTWNESARRQQKENLDKELVKGRDIVSVLVELYHQELGKLMSNYKALEALDPSVLQELDVNLSALKEAMRQKVEGLKDRYWQELFDNMYKITSRLTTDARKRMLDKLTQHTHVDFTASNAHAILIWVIKNANEYFDSQLVTLVERMTEQANVVLYASNQRVFTNEQWRYHRTPESLSRYYLDFRIVLHRVGGLCVSTWDHERKQYNGLSQRAFELLSDILTVASNLHYTIIPNSGPETATWESNKTVEFLYYDEVKHCTNVLMVVRAFKNGNLHLKMNQSFACRLNVEFGRLKGWLKHAAQACNEMNITQSEAEASFKTNIQLCGNDLLALTGPKVGGS